MPWPPDMKTALNLHDNPLVVCACRRSANADMMRDVRPVKVLLGTSADYLCDSCMEHFHRTGRLTVEAYCSALGAPPALVTKAAARTLAIRAARNV